MKKREWSEGIGNEVVFLVDNLIRWEKFGVIADCGAGEGRHSIFACLKGAKRVIAIEKDPGQVALLSRKKREKKLSNLELVEGDVLEKLQNMENESLDGIIDSGMSHCLTDDGQRSLFASLIHSKLKTGGLYSITHFSQKEVLSEKHYRTSLRKLRKLFPGNKWKGVMRWQRASWKRKDGKKHHAYKAVLMKK